MSFDLREIERELYEEEQTLNVDAYECNWLPRFVEAIGPTYLNHNATPYEIFTSLYYALLPLFAKMEQ